jgi:hypothetical protein
VLVTFRDVDSDTARKVTLPVEEYRRRVTHGGLETPSGSEASSSATKGS